MKYKIIYSKKAQKFLSNLDKSISQIIRKKIIDLGTEPLPRDKNHIIEKVDKVYMCELSFKKWRVYYLFYDKKVIVDKIQYEGKIEILDGSSSHKSGSKDNWSNQNKFIRNLKKFFKKGKL